MKNVLKLTLCVLLFCLSLWMIWPGRNEFGNPSDEELLASCETDDSIVRLYRGNGGATVSFSWSITSQNRKSPFEWQIFYTYSSPAIDSLECLDSKVIALEGNKVVTEISSEVVSAPAVGKVPGLYRGDAEYRYRNPFFKITTYLALIFLIPACVILWRLFKAKKN